MGGQSSKETKTAILNDTSVRVALKNVNESISNMQMSIIQESMQKTAAGANISQEVSIKNLTAKGDIILGDVDQSANVKVNMSALSDSEIKSDLVSEVVSKMQTQLANSMSTEQSAAKEESEQIFAAAFEALGDAMAAVTGTDTSSSTETDIKNILNIDSNTELVNKIEQNMSTELVNKTVNEVSNVLVGDQKVEYNNIESTTGGIVIGNINLEMVSEQMTEAITKSGTSTELMSKMANISAADIQNAVDAGQTAEEKKKALIESVGEAAGEVIEKSGEASVGVIGAAGTLAASMGMWIIIPVLLVGGAVLFIFRGTIDAGARQQMGLPQQGGSKKTIKKMKSIISSVLKTIKTYTKKYITRKNLIMLIITILVVLVLQQVYIMIQKQLSENFTNDSKMIDVTISSNGKYLKNQKLGDNHLCLTADESKAFKFNVSKLDDKTITLYTLSGDKKLYLKLTTNDITIEEFDSTNKEKYNFTFKKLSNNTYTFSQGDRYLGFKSNCLTVVQKDDVSQLLFQ